MNSIYFLPNLNWKEHSLPYLCRSFDNIYKDDDYINAIPVIQISILDFTLFPENPEFYATYMMKNVKNSIIYTSFFKAKTWKELKAMAATNQYLHHL